MRRTTADTVALILASTVAIVVIATTLALLYLRLTQPSVDPTPAAMSIGRLVEVMVAALIGYMAGRRVNGQH